MWPLHTHVPTPTSGDECVEDDLGAIEEITKLSLPEGQQLRALDAHAVLESQDGLFGQWAVADLVHRKGTETLPSEGSGHRSQ